MKTLNYLFITFFLILISFSSFGKDNIGVMIFANDLDVLKTMESGIQKVHLNQSYYDENVSIEWADDGIFKKTTLENDELVIRVFSLPKEKFTQDPTIIRQEIERVSSSDLGVNAYLFGLNSGINRSNDSRLDLLRTLNKVLPDYATKRLFFVGVGNSEFGETLTTLIEKNKITFVDSIFLRLNIIGAEKSKKMDNLWEDFKEDVHYLISEMRTLSSVKEDGGIFPNDPNSFNMVILGDKKEKELTVNLFNNILKDRGLSNLEDWFLLPLGSEHLAFQQEDFSLNFFNTSDIDLYAEEISNETVELFRKELTSYLEKHPVKGICLITKPFNRVDSGFINFSKNVRRVIPKAYFDQAFVFISTSKGHNNNLETIFKNAGLSFSYFMDFYHFGDLTWQANGEKDAKKMRRKETNWRDNQDNLEEFCDSFLYREENPLTPLRPFDKNDKGGKEDNNDVEIDGKLEKKINSIVFVYGEIEGKTKRRKLIDDNSKEPQDKFDFEKVFDAQFVSVPAPHKGHLCSLCFKKSCHHDKRFKRADLTHIYKLETEKEREIRKNRPEYDLYLTDQREIKEIDEALHELVHKKQELIQRLLKSYKKEEVLLALSLLKDRSNCEAEMGRLDQLKNEILGK